MKFINEFVSEEDVSNYKLDDLWKRFHPFKDFGPNSDFKYSWTISEDRNVFFIPILTGKEDLSNNVTCVLNIKGTEIIIKLEKNTHQGSIGADWALLSVDKPDQSSISKEEILSTLKAALEEYGYRGPFRQLDNYKVGFKF